jgi:alpha-glucosidase
LAFRRTSDDAQGRKRTPLVKVCGGRCHDSNMDLTTQPHHDGSSRYTDPGPYALGSQYKVRLRVPRSWPVETVVVRQVWDAEPRSLVATICRETADAVWYEATLEQHNPTNTYRWMVYGPRGYHWVTGAGVVNHDPRDDTDFRTTTTAPAAEWLQDAAIYQIYPDRFATSGQDFGTPDWATVCTWDTPVDGNGRNAARQFYRGDLFGAIGHLDYIKSLGFSAIYLTPIFPAGSTHRYDATSFDSVDPLLGGDEALEALVAAAHERGMKVIGDLTTNHTGVTHEWFQTALHDPNSPERGFYFFGDNEPYGYAVWLGARNLPKLDLRNEELRRRLTHGPDSVVGKWLRPGRFDAWRIDVGNMTGRYKEIDVNAEVARESRKTALEVNPDSVVIAEHGHDATRDLAEGGWSSIMNYSAFTKPLWAWLNDRFDRQDNFWGLPIQPWPDVDGVNIVEGMRDYTATVPWSIAVNQMNLLASHDTPRLMSITNGDLGRVKAGSGIVFTWLGVPSVWMGEELGMTGDWGEDGRKPMPWDKPETWNTELLDWYSTLGAIRRDHEALRRGSLRWAYVAPDVIAYLRETENERLLIVASRSDFESFDLSRAGVGVGASTVLEPLIGTTDVITAGEDAITIPGGGAGFRLWTLDAVLS